MLPLRLAVQQQHQGRPLKAGAPVAAAQIAGAGQPITLPGLDVGEVPLFARRLERRHVVASESVRGEGVLSSKNQHACEPNDGSNRSLDLSSATIRSDP